MIQRANQLERAEIFRSAVHEISRNPKGEFVAEGLRRAGNEFFELDSTALDIAYENTLHSAFREAAFVPLSPSRCTNSTIDRCLRFRFRSSRQPLDIVAGLVRCQHHPVFP